MSPILVRPAEAAEIDAVSALARRTFPLACPPDLPPAAIETFCAEHLGPEHFADHLRDPEADLLVAVAGEPAAIVGYALSIAGTAMDPACAPLLTLEPTTGISKIYVDAAVQGGGVAPALLDTAVARSAARGSAGVWLATNVHNARARRFYVRNGFVERGPRTFVVGGVRNEDVVYERRV